MCAEVFLWRIERYSASQTQSERLVRASCGDLGARGVDPSEFALYSDDWQPAVYALAVVTLLVGSTIAVVQTDVKRMLAYSSISHAGFILVGVTAGKDGGHLRVRLDIPHRGWTRTGREARSTPA